jgi:hypothetical protein
LLPGVPSWAPAWASERSGMFARHDDVGALRDGPDHEVPAIMSTVGTIWSSLLSTPGVCAVQTGGLPNQVAQDSLVLA